MKKLNFKSLLPHLIAVAIFLVIALVISKPALESGIILKQSDMTGWHGMSQQSFEYKAAHGHFPLWITSMFSGMPAYQVAMEGAWSPLSFIDKMFQLWLPQPMNFFFLACICFYFMCICLRLKPLAAIPGALAFAYCSFNPIIITAGHQTQMFALAYAPAVIGSVILIFNKKYIAGFTLTALFTALQIGQGHQQISYYLFIILIALTINYIVRWFKAGELPHMGRSLGLLAGAGILGVAINALLLLTAYDFVKESKRGGQLLLDNNANEKLDKEGKTSGLSKTYAFQWSYGKTETFTLMFPGVMGYGNHYAERDGEGYMFPQLDENAKVAKYLSETLNLPPNTVEQVNMQMSQSLYWGDQPFTNGPIYLGAVVCMLFFIGMFVLDGKHKWWILATCIFAIMLSWGRHFPGFNYFMFDYLPFYNKFRVPTMILVIPQLLFALMASLTLNRLVSNPDETTWRKFKMGMLATTMAFVVGIGIYASSDFAKENKQRTTAFNNILNNPGPDDEPRIAALDYTLQPERDNRIYEQMAMAFKGDPSAQKTAREIVSALRQDRQSLFMKDMLRSFIYILIAAALIALYLKRKIMATIMLAGIGILIVADLMGFAMKYLNEKSFDSKETYEDNEFPLSNADRTILADKDPNYRVFNLAGGDPFVESKTSYYHKSIGGYHAAKIGIYDDLASYQLSGQPNIEVLNMLNARYIIQKQGNELVASRNPGALGNAWFVNAVKFVKGPAEEMRALTGFVANDTAIVDEQFKNTVGSFSPVDSQASIRMTSFDNDAIVYETSTAAPHVAVFSEVYYKDWKAYLDGKEVPFFKANYVLRAMTVPAGQHKIEFKFEPASYYTGRSVSNISTWILMIILIGFIAYEFTRKRNQPA